MASPSHLAGAEQSRGHVWCLLSEGGRLPGFTFAEELLNGLGAGAAHLLWGVDHG